MKNFTPFEVVVPCSTANLGPGFDSIGMALTRYLRLRFFPADELSVSFVGGYGNGISLGEDNLVVQVMKGACEDAHLPFTPFYLEIENEIPLARGLGSSAAAIVGGYVAVNHLYGGLWGKEEILQKATHLEGHPDNVGAALYGGAVISSWDGTKASLIPCDPPDLPIVVAVPKQPLSTKLARKCLPSFYAKEDVVLSSSRANLLVAVLFAKRWDLLSVAMRDGFHQPYREPLVPGLKEVLKNAEKHGAYGAALSGAGPTIIVFARDEKRVASYLTKVFAELKVPVEIMELKPCHQGALVQLTERQNHSKVVEKI